MKFVVGRDLFSHGQSLAPVFVCLVLASACNQGPNMAPLTTIGGLTMGTTYTIKISDVLTDEAVGKINAKVSDILFDINNKMSTYIDSSELSRINQAKAGEFIPLSDDLHEVINDAIAISTLTGGSFDITVGPLVNLWGFGPPARARKIPTDADISTALAATGMQHIRLRSSPAALQKTATNVYIDLSGIAKGHGVDRIAEYLEQQHVRNYMVEIGGEIRARGINESGIAWRIGIEKPVTGERAVQRIIRLENIAMATSGDYRNYFEQDGIRYSHTIDPQTGQPVTHNLVSVTVLHRSATWADALATGFLVMGREGANTVATRENIAVLFIERTDAGTTESYTPPFAHYLAED